jgi:N-acetylmuramic acid 6-phosphate etherase
MTPELPQTEAVARGGADLDRLPADALVERLVLSQRGVADVVLEQGEAIATAVVEIVARLERGGRLHYVGAGTSGRLAMLDAAEMPPTFGTDPGLVVAHVAGGNAALVRAVEGAEDDADAGRAAMARADGGDAVVGISASGRAPFVIAALALAREKGCFTLAVVNADPSPLAQTAERAIVVQTGAEPIAGSTRMRAGTAQKIVLNTISTAVMVLRGHVHENLMVDLVATNEKLRARAIRLVERIAGVDAMHARTLLESARGSVKTAIVMARRDCDERTAQALLANAKGRLRSVLGE